MDPNRRSFAASGYSNAQQPMYAFNMVSTGPGPSNFYTTSPQTSLPPASVPYLPPPHTQQQHILHPPLNPYDGLPNGRYETGPALGNQLRTGSLGHPHHQMAQHGFENYLGDNGGFGQHDADLKDQQQRLHQN